MSTRNNDLVQELEQLEQLDVQVDDWTFRAARSEDLEQYDNMGISALADLFILLYN